MNPRLLEIEAEEQQVRQIIAEALTRLANLGNERQAILTMTVNRSGPMLRFDPDGKTIRWDGGQVVLGGKSFRFVKALWFAKKRRLPMNRLGKDVWDDSLVKTKTVSRFIERLQIALKESFFPYQLRKTKNPKTKEHNGFALRATK